MFNAKQSTIACPECGQRNRAEARFCEACAARLGAEPSIASTRAPTRAPLPRATAPVPLAASAASAAAGSDSRFDAPRTVHSRPLPLQAQAANNSGFWIKFCIGGLIVMIGFIAWSLYILTGSKAPTQLPTGQAGTASAPATSAVPPSTAAAPVVTPAAAVPAATHAAAALSLPARPAPSVATATSNVPPVVERFQATEPSAARPAAARQAAARQRARPAPSEVQPADFGGWVEPSRPPAMTSSPNYQDAGPPVVAGPSPTAGPGLSPTPSPSSGSSEPFVRMRPAPSANVRSAVNGSSDLGPPVTAGPGPHYDYSTPNAAGR